MAAWLVRAHLGAEVFGAALKADEARPAAGGRVARLPGADLGPRALVDGVVDVHDGPTERQERQDYTRVFSQRVNDSP